jgi:Lhr-like helicase
VPVIEVGIVVGYLVAWAVQKARRAGHRLDETANLAIDVSADRLGAS